MKVNRIILSLTFFVLTIIFTFPFSGFAAENLTVNGESVSKGDIVTFTYYMSDVESPIEAAGAYITFNPEFLEYIDGSIGFDVLENAMVNVGEESIYYCAINITDGFYFKNEGLVVTVSFKVLDTASGSTVILNTFDEIFTFENEEEDLTSEDYTSRQVISVNNISDNVKTHSGINANDVTETFDTALTKVNELESPTELSNGSGLSVKLMIVLVIVFLAVVVGIVVFISKEKQK